MPVRSSLPAAAGPASSGHSSSARAAGCGPGGTGRERAGLACWPPAADGPPGSFTARAGPPSSGAAAGPRVRLPGWGPAGGSEDGGPEAAGPAAREPLGPGASCARPGAGRLRGAWPGARPPRGARGLRGTGHRPHPHVQPQQGREGAGQDLIMPAAGEPPGVALTGERDRQYAALQLLHTRGVQEHPGHLLLAPDRIQDLRPALAQRFRVHRAGAAARAWRVVPRARVAARAGIAARARSVTRAGVAASASIFAGVSVPA